MGGGNEPTAFFRRAPKGLSPRGRGKQTQAGSTAICARSIPAWAGETNETDDEWDSGRVYPRVGGGNRTTFSSGTSRSGLSPRGRGKPGESVRSVYLNRSIPAWAGETRCSLNCLVLSAVYPRVGGGNLFLLTSLVNWRGLSPRGRGKLGLCPPCPLSCRSIPAWAGETLRQAKDIVVTRVYPRVGGGNGAYRMVQKHNEGLSPRGRGKHRRRNLNADERRSIPAWAGETV